MSVGPSIPFAPFGVPVILSGDGRRYLRLQELDLSDPPKFPWRVVFVSGQALRDADRTRPIRIATTRNRRQKSHLTRCYKHVAKVDEEQRNPPRNRNSADHLKHHKCVCKKCTSKSELRQGYGVYYETLNLIKSISYLNSPFLLRNC